MEGREAVDGAESEEFQLLMAYTRRRQQRSLCMTKRFVQCAMNITPQGPVHFRSGENSAATAAALCVAPISSDTLEKQRESAPFSGVADRLVQIVDSATIPQEELVADCLDDQGVLNLARVLVKVMDDPFLPPQGESLHPATVYVLKHMVKEIIRKLVELLKMSGDVIDKKIKQNEVLQQQLQTNFNYALFERLITHLHTVVNPGQMGREAGSEDRIQKEKIAWAFEVTSRLSTMELLPRRRALSFGERYLSLHHSAWVQQQGGWEKVFDSADID